jgi:hypothetical protein
MIWQLVGQDKTGATLYPTAMGRSGAVEDGFACTDCRGLVVCEVVIMLFIL